MSVEICAVTATSSPAGTAARTIHATARRTGGGAAASCGSPAARVRPARTNTTPQAAISRMRTQNPADQARLWSVSRVSGSTASGYEISARKLPTLLAA